MAPRDLQNGQLQFVGRKWGWKEREKRRAVIKVQRTCKLDRDGQTYQVRKPKRQILFIYCYYQTIDK